MADLITNARSVIANTLIDATKPCITCSFQGGGIVVLDMLRQIIPDIPVLFLDTGYHFQEVIDYRNRLAEMWNLNVVDLRAKQTVAQQEAQYGLLNVIDPSRCCHMRKVEPMMEGLKGYDLWFTGLRRTQSGSREDLQPVEQHVFPNGLSLKKVNPLFDWKTSEVNAYFKVREIPVLPLYEQGYTSIGCEPCTQKPKPGEHERSGRWGGTKAECGLHTISAKVA